MQLKESENFVEPKMDNKKKVENDNDLKNVSLPNPFYFGNLNEINTETNNNSKDIQNIKNFNSNENNNNPNNNLNFLSNIIQNNNDSIYKQDVPNNINNNINNKNSSLGKNENGNQGNISVISVPGLSQIITGEMNMKK